MFKHAVERIYAQSITRAHAHPYATHVRESTFQPVSLAWQHIMRTVASKRTVRTDCVR